MNASRGGSRDDKIPGGLDDTRRPQLLPERDVEFAPRRFPTHQPRHDYPFAIGHMSIITLTRPVRHANP
jgi:hypothetical protein